MVVGRAVAKRKTRSDQILRRAWIRFKSAASLITGFKGRDKFLLVFARGLVVVK